MSLSKSVNKAQDKNSDVLTVNRVEHKYIITVRDAVVLAHKLPLLLKADEHNGVDGYMVRSLYFDTPYNKDYYAKDDGEFERQKIRLRIYSVQDENVKLECKSKKGDFQKKTSMILNRDQASRIIKGNHGILLDIGTDEAVDMYSKMTGYKPAVIVQYNRKAFFWPVNDTRITIDSNVCGCETQFDLFADHFGLTPALYGNSRILEVKYSGKLEPAVASLLAGCNRTRTSFSKYNNTRFFLNRF